MLSNWGCMCTMTVSKYVGEGGGGQGEGEGDKGEEWNPGMIQQKSGPIGFSPPPHPLASPLTADQRKGHLVSSDIRKSFQATSPIWDWQNSGYFLNDDVRMSGKIWNYHILYVLFLPMTTKKSMQNIECSKFQKTKISKYQIKFTTFYMFTAHMSPTTVQYNI